MLSDQEIQELGHHVRSSVTELVSHQFRSAFPPVGPAGWLSQLAQPVGDQALEIKQLAAHLSCVIALTLSANFFSIRRRSLRPEQNRFPKPSWPGDRRGTLCPLWWIQFEMLLTPMIPWWIHISIPGGGFTAGPDVTLVTSL